MDQVTHRSFRLHDGEDDKRTDELHEFLEQPTHTRGHDWDGHNSGITILLDVQDGDTIVVIGDGAFLILRKSEPVKITWATFPLVSSAMRLVELDNGAHHVNRIHNRTIVDMDTFTMPYEYGVDKLVQAENAFFNYYRECGDELFREFVTGDQDVAEENMKTRPGLQAAHKLMNDWFNGWETT
jgi:hypothetical protein